MIEIRPNPGPQEHAFASPADILIYGGAAGGGKSFYLLTEPVRHIRNPEFGGVIFRREFTQVTQVGGLWDESQKIYRGLGGKDRSGNELDWTFPSGAKVKFAHLQHEKDKYKYQGGQITYAGFDELTHFSETQFWYIVSRMRSSAADPYIRATCNPEPGWVADLIDWWIGDDGFAIPERSGVIRYLSRSDEGEGEIVWGDTREELIDRYPDLSPDDILSFTFVSASLEDNPKVDKRYKSKLKALPRVERERLLRGNWRVAEGTLIDADWLKTYTIIGPEYEFLLANELIRVPANSARRFATIDTAGTSKEKAAEKRGDPASWSVCCIWDYLVRYDLLLLVHVWRDRVDWNGLKTRVPSVLKTWRCNRCYIENAHYGQPLSKEITGVNVELIGPCLPGMDDSSRGAKLERAVASGMLARVEDGLLRIPDSADNWIPAYRGELLSWTGLPKETSDQIDTTSYGSYVAKTRTGSWGGVINTNRKGR